MLGSTPLMVWARLKQRWYLLSACVLPFMLYHSKKEGKAGRIIWLKLRGSMESWTGRLGKQCTASDAWSMVCSNFFFERFHSESHGSNQR